MTNFTVNESTGHVGDTCDVCKKHLKEGYRYIEIDLDKLGAIWICLKCIESANYLLDDEE